MTREELHEKVAKFVHGVNSDGTWHMPWEHDNGCEWCDGLIDFIGKILQDYNKAEDVFYPKEPEHFGGVFDCPACKVK